MLTVSEGAQYSKHCEYRNSFGHLCDSPVLSFTPEPVNAADSDVTIACSDGVLFRVHKNNLATHSEVFPEGDLATNDEIVQLTETSSTLELLFQYMYRQP